MIASWLLVLAPQTALETAVQRTNAGDFRSAWSAASSAVDPLERAQAKVFVRQHAGDLAGALDEAQLGTRAALEDPWLAERTLAIAVSLSRAKAAANALSQLDALLLDPNVPNRGAYLEAASRVRSRVDALSTGARARDTAESRARFVVLGFSVTALCALVFLARKA
ncbi:MAG: hypothetical protein SGI72_14100 [Planctomycetota bacterium]|nr:hypothetical protein [Planctomycetota bacterium]